MLYCDAYHVASFFTNVDRNSWDMRAQAGDDYFFTLLKQFQAYFRNE